MKRRKRLERKARRAERVRVKEVRTVKRREQAEAFAARVAEGERRGCLFCRERDGGFTAVEHSLPESLGNTEVALPNGVVCDRCNNSVLSRLDQTLVEFMPLKLRRTMLGVPSKTGKVPETRFSKGTITNKGRDPKTGENQLFFAINSPNDTHTFRTTELGGGLVQGNFKVSGGRRMTARYASELSRALLKVSFECAWLDHGEAMLKPEFDHVREAVLGAPRDGYLVVPRNTEPDDVGLELTYMPLPAEGGGQFLAVAARFYGIWLGTDSMNPEPKIPVPEDYAMVFTFTKEDTRLHEKRTA